MSTTRQQLATTPVIRLLPMMPTERTRVLNAQRRCTDLEAKARLRGLSAMESTQLRSARLVLLDSLRSGRSQ